MSKNKKRRSQTVNVLGLAYEVRVGGCEPGEDGFCSPSKQLICIREGLSEEKAHQVYLHELIHAILDQLAFTDLYEDERLVQGLAIGLYQALVEPISSS